MNSFTGVFQVFYLLFKRLRNMTWWLLPLFVNCQILNVEKTIEQQKQSPEGVFYKKVHLRISKKSLENTCARVSSQRDSNTCFPVKYAKFILQNTFGGINKKKQSSQTKSFVENTLLLYNWLIT